MMLLRILEVIRPSGPSSPHTQTYILGACRVQTAAYSSARVFAVMTFMEAYRHHDAIKVDYCVFASGREIVSVGWFLRVLERERAREIGSETREGSLQTEE